MMSLWQAFTELVVTPFQRLDLIWGIVPLYFGLLLNELTPGKANFLTAVQTGFSFVWAGLQWLYPYVRGEGARGPTVDLASAPPLNLIVTVLVLLLGVAALFSGLRRRFPRYGHFLGHTRFANYFMIVIFPIQAHELAWTWQRLAAVVAFAVPVWLVLHFGLMPLRGRRNRKASKPARAKS